MNKAFEWLKGKKTYIFSFIGAALWAAHSSGLIGDETWKMLMGFDVFGIIASFRSAIIK
jgi:hypothetical protein